MHISRGLEERICDIRKKSTEELVAAIKYTRPDFTAEEEKDILRFWSNADLPVFTAKHQGILSGSFISKESRAITDLRTTSLKIFNQSPEIKQALSQMHIPDVLNVLGRDFYERVFDDFGDDSVAQLVPGTVAFEGMSFLYSMQVSHHRFIPKIGKSSRYRDFSKKNSLGQYQYLVDPFIIEAGLENSFREVADGLFQLYEGFASKEGENRQELLEQLKELLPYDAFCIGVQKDLQKLGMGGATAAELEQAYGKTLVPMRFDIARHLLPLATISATAALVNGQSTRDLLLHGYTTPRGESLVYSELLRRELEPAFGSLLSDVDPQPVHPDVKKQEKKMRRSQEWRNFLHTQRTVKDDLAQYVLKNTFLLSAAENSRPDDEFPEYLVEEQEFFHRILDSKTGVEIEIATDDDLTDLVTAILRESHPHITLGEAKYITQNMPVQQQRENTLKYAATELRKNRRHKPGRAFERINIEISIKGITIGELRDLRRHRTQTNLEPPYFSPQQGFYIAAPLQEIRLAEKLKQQYKKAAEHYQILAEKINPETASTILPLGTKITSNMQINLRQAHHLIELRTQPGAHGNYLRICQMLYVGMKYEFPIVRDTMTYVNKETEIDYGRAVQEIRALRKIK